MSRKMKMVLVGSAFIIAAVIMIVLVVGGGKHPPPARSSSVAVVSPPPAFAVKCDTEQDSNCRLNSTKLLNELNNILLPRGAGR